MSTWKDDMRQIRSTGQNDPGFVQPAQTDDDVNADAVSFGAMPSPSFTPVAEGGLPCLTVAGVTVFLYRQDGRMVISIDTDMADETTPYKGSGWPPLDPQDGEADVSMQIDVNGVTVWADMDDQEGKS